MDETLFIPTSILNDIRRTAINLIETKIINSFKRNTDSNFIKIKSNCSKKSSKQTSLLLNILNLDYNYSLLKHFDKIYIPLKYFADKKYEDIIKNLEHNSKIYIYMPAIIKDRFYSLIKSKVNLTLEKFNISGAVVSEMSSINLFKNKELIANYNFNIFNSYSAKEIENFGFNCITLSPELQSEELSNIKLDNTDVIKIVSIYV